MPMSTVPRRQLVVLIPLLLIAAFAWWAPRFDSEAAPAAAPASASPSQAGKITFDSLPGAPKSTVPLRSFGAGGVNSSAPTGGGGGTGKFAADDVTAVIDAASVDPSLLQAITTGVHLSEVSVTLFRAGTTERQESWELTDVTVSEMRITQTGSAKSPRVSLGLRYRTVTVTTYDARGGVALSYCFNLAASTTC